MSDDENDTDYYDCAYREYLRERISDAYIEDLGTEQFEQWVRMIVRLLRRWRNAPLADRYEAAFAAVQRLLPDGVSYPTDDATEHFERVQTEALAWLQQRLDENT